MTRSLCRNEEKNEQLSGKVTEIAESIRKGRTLFTLHSGGTLPLKKVVSVLHMKTAGQPPSCFTSCSSLQFHSDKYWKGLLRRGTTERRASYSESIHTDDVVHEGHTLRRAPLSIMSICIWHTHTKRGMSSRSWMDGARGRKSSFNLPLCIISQQFTACPCFVCYTKERTVSVLWCSTPAFMHHPFLSTSSIPLTLRKENNK